MKTRKKILPNWIVKNIAFEHENESVSSAVVGVIALYIVGVIGLLVSKPVGGEDLWMEIGIAICILAIIVAFIAIFVARVALLERTRIKAVKAYKKAERKEKEAKTTEERTKALEEKAIWQETLDALYVQLEKAA